MTLTELADAVERQDLARVLRPQFCNPAPGEGGDCYRACLATILGVDASDVPNFNRHRERDDLRFDREVREFLAPLGRGIFNFYCDGGMLLETALEYYSKFNLGVPMILRGRPAYADDPAHSVVVLNGSIVHDPSGAGIAGPAGEYWFFDVVATLRAMEVE